MKTEVSPFHHVAERLVVDSTIVGVEGKPIVSPGKNVSQGAQSATRFTIENVLIASWDGAKAVNAGFRTFVCIFPLTREGSESGRGDLKDAQGFVVEFECADKHGLSLGGRCAGNTPGQKPAIIRRGKDNAVFEFDKCINGRAFITSWVAMNKTVWPPSLTRIGDGSYSAVLLKNTRQCHAAKFGLPAETTAAAAAVKALIQAPKPEAVPATPATDEGKKSNLLCTSCGVAVAYNVAKFCWFNKPRFSGKVFCFECQKAVPNP